MWGETRLTIPDEDANRPDLALYRLEVTPTLGMNDQTLVYGPKLACVFSWGHDPLNELLQNVGGDDALMSVQLPDGGLVPGQLYKAGVCNIRHDPESGYVDEWDVALWKYDGEIPQHSADCLCNDCTSGIGDGP